MNNVIHIHGSDSLLNGIRTPQFRMNHHDSGYSNQIIGCILCYPIVMMTSHSTVPDSLSLFMHVSGKLIGSVDTIVCGLALLWNSCTHGLHIIL